MRQCVVACRRFTLQLLGLVVCSLSQSSASPPVSNLCDGEFRIVPRSFGQLYEDLEPVISGICAYISPPPVARPAAERWTAAANERLGPLVRLVQSALSRDPFASGWNPFSAWLHELSLTSDVIELRAVLAPIFEAKWRHFEVPQGGALGQNFSALQLDVGTQLKPSKWVAEAISSWKRAGRRDEAERFWREVLAFEEPWLTGFWPWRHLFDTLTPERAGNSPWPGLRPLEWPEPKDVLPNGVAEDLVASHVQIAGEARKLTTKLATQDDAYKTITRGGQWTQLTLYNMDQGWNEDLCQTMKGVCALLKGRLRSESAAMRPWFKNGLLIANDETVTVFRVRGPGFAHLHTGQDLRVNVHFCLVNCNGSTLSVGGVSKSYFDGSLFAFEDRMDHEVVNALKGKDRINLVVGVLHPDFLPDGLAHPTPYNKLGIVLAALNHTSGRLPQPVLDSALLVAAGFGHLEPMKILLDRGAAIDARDEEGLQATHLACWRGLVEVLRLVLAKGADARARDGSGREPIHMAAASGAREAAELLVQHGANAHARSDALGTALEIARRQGKVEMAAYLSSLPIKQKKRRRKKGGKKAEL